MQSFTAAVQEIPLSWHRPSKKRFRRKTVSILDNRMRNSIRRCLEEYKNQVMTKDVEQHIEDGLVLVYYSMKHEHQVKL